MVVWILLFANFSVSWSHMISWKLMSHVMAFVQRLYTRQHHVLRGIACRSVWRTGSSTHLWPVHD